MTIQDIMAKLKEIVALAEEEDRPLTDEEVERYEELEGALQMAQRTSEIQKRQAAYEAPRVNFIRTGPHN